MHKAAKKYQEYDLHADLERIKSAITDAAFDVKGKAGAMFHETLDTAKERSTSIRNNLGDYAKDQPLRTIGVSMLIGMVFGFFLHK